MRHFCRILTGFLVVTLAPIPVIAQGHVTLAKLPYAKLDTSLARAVVDVESGWSRETAVARLENSLARPSEIPVSIRTDNVQALLDSSSITGIRVANIGSRVVEAYVTPEALRELNGDPAVIHVSEIIPPQATLVSQAVAVHEADHWQARGYLGRGVKIGIIDSFAGFASLMGSELPATVTARCYSGIGAYSDALGACDSDSSCHGTAVAESLIDVAPSAQLFIANPKSQLDFRQTIDWMTSQGVRVINFSATWTWDGPGDGTSTFPDSPLRSVDAAVSGGALFVVSAGNHARATYFGGFSDVDGDNWAEFNGIEHNSVVLQAGETIAIQLRWQDTWGFANRDLDLGLYDPWNNLVASSANYQDGRTGATPREILVFRATSSGSYRIGVLRYSGNLPGWMQLQSFTQQSLSQYSGSGSIGNPAESANAGVMAVGASAWSTPETIEYFSSRGPTPDGRTKPDVVGADRADTVTYGYCGFAGTSQAAPHVAGLAALVSQAFPSFTPAQLGWYLRSSAAPRNPGPNNTWGYGFATLPSLARARTDDYDGDGKGDVTVFRPSSGIWYQLRSATGTGYGVAWGITGDLPAPGDYDGDGTTDAAVFRPSTGTWFILLSTTGTGVGVTWGLAGDVPVPADYDGDRKTDVAVWRPSTGVWYIIQSSTNSAIGVSWGTTGDVPVPADFDGDGKADPTVFRPASGTWYELRSTTGAGYGVLWGQLGDVPLAGDYDGDGRADPTVFRASTGTWYELRSTTGVGYGVLWGTVSDIPIVGDYDGDGKADPTVFRPSSNTWYQLRSTTGLGYGVVWGATGDLPQ